MRKLLISILLASAVATPALADPDHNDHQNARAEHSESRGKAHEEHSQRVAPAERPQVNGQNHVNGATGGGGNGFNGAVNASGQAHFNGAVGGQGRFNGVQQGGQGDAVQTEQSAVRNADHNRGPHVVNNNTVNNARDWRNGDRRGFNGQQNVEQAQQVGSGGPHTVVNDTLRQSDRPLPNVMRTHNRSLIVSDVPRPGTQPPLRTNGRHNEAAHWNTNWRNDGHHDWHNWRHRHHSWFHLGFYYDPFGWGYQPYSVGWRMWPNYYSSSFWINDPWQYRLPYAPPGTQWVRYYNDAVLVDTYTGEVLDVVYNFFW